MQAGDTPKVVTPKAKRAALAHLKETDQMSERRACRLLEAPRSSMRYRPRPRDNEAVLDALKAHSLRGIGALGTGSSRGCYGGASVR